MSAFYGAPAGGTSLTSQPTLETLGGGTGTGTTVTGGAADTKGSYATLGTTTFAWEGFDLLMQGGGNADVFRVDVAYNSGSDTIVVADVFFDITASAVMSHRIWCPVQIPSGAAVKVRCQSDGGASRTLIVIATGYSAGKGGATGKSGIISLTDYGTAGADTLPANPVTMTGQTFTAWTDLCASTSATVIEFWAHVSRHGDSTRTTSQILIEIGVGAAAAEVKIGAMESEQNTSGIYNSSCNFPCYIPSGSRISYRVQTSDNTTTDSISIGAVGLKAT